MEILISMLVTLVIGFLTYCLIVLNNNKDELWEEIYKRLRR